MASLRTDWESSTESWNSLTTILQPSIALGNWPTGLANGVFSALIGALWIGLFQKKSKSILEGVLKIFNHAEYCFGARVLSQMVSNYFEITSLPWVHFWFDAGQRTIESDTCKLCVKPELVFFVDGCKFKQYPHHPPLMHCQLWPGYCGRHLKYYSLTFNYREKAFGEEISYLGHS